jgi:hypothetical protein
MKKILIVVAVLYVLPKGQPIYQGMIVRCDQPREILQLNGPSYISKGPFACHWECEFGPTTDTYVENGNQKTRDSGCASKPWVTVPNNIQCPAPMNYMGL